MTEFEAAMWRYLPEDAARIEANLADPSGLVDFGADEL